jgi:NAD-dependent dihydropyrimidine dehydrogenase PreA subunit
MPKTILPTYCGNDGQGSRLRTCVGQCRQYSKEFGGKSRTKKFEEKK